jgi:hypothetical protein
VAGKDRLYRALDKALEHRDALIGHLHERWSDLFGAECQILLYDLTSTYFEGVVSEDPRNVTLANRATKGSICLQTRVESEMP